MSKKCHWTEKIVDKLGEVAVPLDQGQTVGHAYPQLEEGEQTFTIGTGITAG